MRTFQLINVKADTPYERGLQYGQQAREKIISGIEDYKVLFSETSSMSWEEIRSYALEYINISEKLIPDVMEEARGISIGSGTDLADIMVLNTRYEITKFSEPNECTSFSVLPQASKRNKMYVGQNWDYRAGILDNIVMIHIEEPDGMRIFGIAEAGQVIRNGFNSYGIGLCANNLQSIYDTRGTGIPVTFLRRKVLASKSFDDAFKLLVEAPRSVSCNFMLASAEGKAVDLETYPGGADVIEPVEGIIAHANHFMSF